MLKYLTKPYKLFKYNNLNKFGLLYYIKISKNNYDTLLLNENNILNKLNHIKCF